MFKEIIFLLTLFIANVCFADLYTCDGYITSNRGLIFSMDSKFSLDDSVEVFDLGTDIEVSVEYKVDALFRIPRNGTIKTIIRLKLVDNIDNLYLFISPIFDNYGNLEKIIDIYGEIPSGFQTQISEILCTKNA